MERKLIKQGGGGLTIYLPKKWTDSKKLKEGDSVNVLETASRLIIGSSVKEKRDIEVEIKDEKRRDIQVLLTHLYRKGYDKITLRNLNSELIKEVSRDVSDFLLGFEITHKEDTFCVIESVSEPTEQKYESLLKSVFFINRETINLILEDFEKGKIANFEDMKMMRNNLDKHIYFCRRVITRGDMEVNPVVSWELLTFLMHIQHTGYYLYEFASKNKFEKDKQLISLLKSLKTYFELFEKAYYEKDISAIHKINNLKTKHHFGECLEMLEKGKGKENIAFAYIREMFRLIQIGTSPILSTIFEKEIKED